MRKTNTVKQEVEVEQTVDVVCNKCGNSCITLDDGNVKLFDGLIETEIWGGYGSKLGDMIGYKFSLCENCLDALFKTFVIPVDVRDASLGNWVPENKFEEHMDECMKAFENNQES